MDKLHIDNDNKENVEMPLLYAQTLEIQKNYNQSLDKNSAEFSNYYLLPKKWVDDYKNLYDYNNIKKQYNTKDCSNYDNFKSQILNKNSSSSGNSSSSKKSYKTLKGVNPPCENQFNILTTFSR